MLNIKHLVKNYKVILLVSTLVFPIHSYAENPDSSPYKFDWRKKNDMSGAFMMCGLTGFVLGDCPKVLVKCMTDPALLKVKLFGVESKCLNLFEFLTSSTDVDAALNEAQGRAISENPEAAESISNVDVNDFNMHSNGVIDTHEQNSEPDSPVGRESYAGTIYSSAEIATENLINEDYYNFYYFGDGNGNGGWGAPNFKRDLFESDYFLGMSPSEAYNSAYTSAYNTTHTDVYNSVYNETYNSLISDVSFTFDDISGELEYNAVELAGVVAISELTANNSAELAANNAGISAGNTAKANQLAFIESSYATWKDEQPWASFGYERTGFESSYNLERLSIYYEAYIIAAESCGISCAPERASNALAGVPYYTG